MALGNIGKVNFGVDANTTGLQKAITKLNAFQKQTNQIAKSQQKGAQATVNAMARQESAIKKAFQQVKNMQEASKKLGGTNEEVAQRTTNATRAFQKLTKEMTSGALATKDFRRSQDAFAASIGRSARKLQTFKTDRARAQATKFTETMRNLESASVLAVGPLSGIGARIRSLGAIFGRSSLKIAGVVAGITAVSIGMLKLGQNAFRAGVIVEESMARFKAASGSLAISRKQMNFVINTSRELGLGIETSAKAFSRLTAATRGSALSMEDTRKVFRGVAEAAAALRLSNQEVEGTFRAIEQIISKGSVQAEELRGQLGERLPGAFRIAAKSMGVTTAQLGEMLKAGEVLADDFIPKFVRSLSQAFGEDAKSNVDSVTGSTNNLKNA